VANFDRMCSILGMDSWKFNFDILRFNALERTRFESRTRSNQTDLSRLKRLECWKRLSLKHVLECGHARALRSCLWLLSAINDVFEFTTSHIVMESYLQYLVRSSICCRSALNWRMLQAPEARCYSPCVCFGLALRHVFPSVQRERFCCFNFKSSCAWMLTRGCLCCSRRPGLLCYRF
jgi:hypothetical protein